VDDIGNNLFVSYWGFSNPNPFTVTIPYGPLNHFTLAAEEHFFCPNVFPPVTYAVHDTVTWNAADTLTWFLDGSAVAASLSSLRCATATPTPTATATPVSPPYVQRVNAGGLAYTDGLGQAWAADKPFTAGGWGNLGGMTYQTAGAIAGTTDAPLYQTERYWAESAAPGYRFTVPNGAYQVTLKFAEIYRTKPNIRRFNVTIEGNAVLTDYDPFVTAGGANKAAPDVVVTAPVSDGTLDIGFIRLPGYDAPKVSAIAVVQQ